jgi:hypothetical protein
MGVDGAIILDMLNLIGRFFKAGRGRPTQIFRLLHTSASAKIPELRGKTGNCADAEALNTQKITAPVECTAEGVSDELDAMPTGVLEL